MHLLIVFHYGLLSSPAQFIALPMALFNYKDGFSIFSESLLIAQSLSANIVSTIASFHTKLVKIGFHFNGIKFLTLIGFYIASFPLFSGGMYNSRSYL
jgi:hypothetical protein